MPGLEDLYREIILDHYRSPRNRGELESPPAQRVEGFNPLCGDEIVVTLEVNDDVVSDIKIAGSGCSISQSSASLMSAAVKGKAVPEVRDLIRLKPVELDATRRRLSACHDVADLRAVGRRLIPRPVFDYVDGGSDEELSLRANVRAYQRFRFQPRTLVRRTDLAQAVSRLLEVVASPAQLPAWKSARPKFPDLVETHLAYPAASMAVASGVMTAGPDGSFQPSRAVTGAEAVQSIDRLQQMAAARKR